VRRALKRALESSERAIACPLCKAPLGKPCVYYHNEEQGISAVAHVERKRAAGRAWRVETIRQVIKKHQVIGKAPDPTELAEAIDDALHVPPSERSWTKFKSKSK
jgi:hypothetical protein